MYFRFGCALVLVVLVSVGGVAIERKCLALRRAVSRQHYRYDVLCAMAASLRLKTQQLGAPVRLFAALDNNRSDRANPTRPEEQAEPRVPLVAAGRDNQADR